MSRDTNPGSEPTLVAASDATTYASGGTAPPPVSEALAPGARLGRYVLAGKLGEGGMGTVFAAHDPDLDRKVAIKVLHARLAVQDATGGPQRLLREAQAMARLSHPNVVAVHDVGVVGSRLFIAMELVDGCDLRQWLAATRRSWRAIVEVFVAAGAGLAAAHDAGIIHRDFKPDNVLCARNGRVLVGDFGLAAAAAAVSGPAGSPADPSRSWLEAAGSLTVPGALMGTPAYMAPEQMAGGEITPAVDIFAFCVALFEAIHGQRPFRGDTIANLYVAISEVGPITPPGVKSPRRLARALRRGLAADPKQRQPSMHALLAELRPLIASRRRLWIGGAALVITTAATSTALWLASADAPRCTGGEAAIAGIWSPERRAALAEAFVRTGVVHAADTWARVAADIDEATAAWSAARLDACEATQVRGEQSVEVLDRRVACLDRQLGEIDRLLAFLGEPDAKVLDHAVALTHDLPTSDACDAHALLAAAAPTRGDSPEVAEVEQTISHVHRLHRVGKYEQALAELAPIVDRLGALGEPRLLARALAARAQIGSSDNRQDTAEWIAEALAAAMRAGDDGRFAEVAALEISRVGADPVARALWLRLGEAAVQRHGGDDEVRASLLTAHGNALRVDGRLREAEAVQREALELRRRDPDDAALIADALFSLSAVLAGQERADEAIPLAHEAMQLWERELGPQHPRMISALGNLALLATHEADYAAALGLAARAHDLAALLRGVQHPDTAQSLTLIASIEVWRGEFAAARRHFERSLEIYAASSNARPSKHAHALHAAATFYVDADDFDAAAAALARARALAVPFPPLHPFWVTDATTSAQIALHRGDLATAEQELARGRTMLADSEGAEPLGEMVLALVGAELELRRGRPEKSAALVEPLRTSNPGEFKHPYIRGTVGFLEARIARARGHQVEAATLAEAARAAFASLGPGYAPRIAEITAFLAEQPGGP